jgi:tetratricopeptide (TPR) repeat protein
VVPAYRALQQGRVDEAASLLRARLAQFPADAQAHQLLCRAAYAEDLADTAADECQKAVKAAPDDGDNQMWLGRALGLKAEHASPFEAFSLARKVRTAFERAVQLSPNNGRAAGDLGQFYLGAPGIVGGGTDKAEHLAEQIAAHLPAESHRLKALLAEKQGDLEAARREFEAAVAAGHTPEAYIDLGFFYQRTHRPEEAEREILRAIAADRSRGPVLVDAASILTDANRRPEIAERALREYLESSAQSDSAPVFKAEVELGKLLARRGDKAGAQQQYGAALKLASNYAPARRALKNLDRN